MPIRVLLVDDDPMVLTGLRLLLDSAHDVEVVAEAGHGAEALAVLRSHTVDVVLMDLRMPTMDGVAATRAIRTLTRSPQVIVLTTWDVDSAVLSALEAGASAFLLKTATPAEIVGAIRAVMDGDAVLSPRSTKQLLDHLSRDGTASHRRAAETVVASLTAREREVAVAVGRGLTNSAIAGELYLADATVKAHIATIQTKLGVANRVGIAVLAERAGLLRA